MNNISSKVLPFVFAGMALVAFAFSLVLLTYLFIFGAAVGLVLFLINWIRERYFSKHQVTRYHPHKHKGRVIDSDDWKSM